MVPFVGLTKFFYDMVRTIDTPFIDQDDDGDPMVFEVFLVLILSLSLLEI